MLSASPTDGRMRLADEGQIDAVGAEFTHGLCGDVAAANTFPGQEFELGARLTQRLLRHHRAVFRRATDPGPCSGAAGSDAATR